MAEWTESMHEGRVRQLEIKWVRYQFAESLQGSHLTRLADIANQHALACAPAVQNWSLCLEMVHLANFGDRPYVCQLWDLALKEASGRSCGKLLGLRAGDSVASGARPVQPHCVHPPIIRP